MAKRSNTTGYIGNAYRSCLIGQVIKHLELVVVGVPEELASYCRFVTIHDCIVAFAPGLEAAHRVNVANNVNFLVTIFTLLQDVHQPGQLSKWVDWVDQKPEVQVVTVVHI